MQGILFTSLRSFRWVRFFRKRLLFYEVLHRAPLLMRFAFIWLSYFCILYILYAFNALFSGLKRPHCAHFFHMQLLHFLLFAYLLLCARKYSGLIVLLILAPERSAALYGFLDLLFNGTLLALIYTVFQYLKQCFSLSFICSELWDFKYSVLTHFSWDFTASILNPGF